MARKKGRGFAGRKQQQNNGATSPQTAPQATQNRIIQIVGAVLLLLVVAFFVGQLIANRNTDSAGDTAATAASGALGFATDVAESTAVAPVATEEAATDVAPAATETGSDSSTETSGTAVEGERPLAQIAPAQRNGYYTQYPEMMISTDKQYQAVIQTTNGKMTFDLFADKSPLAVNSFVFLATQGYFDGLTFHRVLEDFMAQGGDPTGVGAGGPGYQFKNENSPDLTFDKRGILAMANAGPDTNGSQFFITFAPYPSLNGGYTIFGQLVEGDDVLSKISLRDPGSATTPGDTITRIDIIEK